MILYKAAVIYGSSVKAGILLVMWFCIINLFFHNGLTDKDINI